MSDAIERAKNDPTNPVLAAAAERAIRDPKFERRGTYCQRFVRQVVEEVYGSKYDAQNDATAELSRRNYIRAGLSVDPKRGSVVGDILYKAPTSAVPEGHVGIRVPGNRVAENSTRSSGRVQGAKGYVSLEDFGPVKTIVRLPRRK